MTGNSCCSRVSKPCQHHLSGSRRRQAMLLPRPMSSRAKAIVGLPPSETAHMYMGWENCFERRCKPPQRRQFEAMIAVRGGCILFADKSHLVENRTSGREEGFDGKTELQLEQRRWKRLSASGSTRLLLFPKELISNCGNPGIRKS